MSFVSNTYTAPDTTKDPLWFLFHNKLLLVEHRESGYRIPRSPDLEDLAITPPALYLRFGSLHGRSCCGAKLAEKPQMNEPFRFIGLRDLFLSSDPDLVRAAGIANQLLQWDQNHRYCGKCGVHTVDKTDERAKICPQCGLINYPRLSPAIIVAVEREGRILLAHSQRFPAKFYSVLAGFVEPGETLEECVKREIQEEVGITVKNIRYFGSQPWPFPDSLMIGFTAEYDTGDICIDPAEITDAGWFPAGKLPPIPPKISIARQLIDWFSKNNPA